MPPPRVRYQLAVSLDGLIAPEDESVEWLAPYNAVGEEVMTPFVAEIGGILMGRRTYETAQRLGGWPFADVPTVVLSSNADLVVPSGFEVCTKGPRAALDALEARMDGGDVWIVGGGRTAAWFLDEGLLDRVELTTVPVVLGAGRPMFAGLHNAATLELASVRAGAGGTVVSVFERRR